MNELQRQKAVEALERHKEQERKKNHAIMYRLGAYAKLHYEGVMLPYKVLYDIEKQEYEKTFTEIPPNPYYPAPGVTRATKNSKPAYVGDTRNLPLNDSGFPDLKADTEYQRQWQEYEKRISAEKMPLEKWGYYYARFLLPYDLSSFSDFDFWGDIPKTEEEKQVVDSLRAACLEAQGDCRKHPEKYNLEPIQRLEEHRTIYDVSYGYI